MTVWRAARACAVLAAACWPGVAAADAPTTAWRAPTTPRPPLLAAGGDAAAVRAWPASGQITFAVRRGDPGFQVGQAVHRWRIDADGRYQLTAATETTGLAALLRAVKVTQASAGRVTASGFQPQRFTMRRGDKPPLQADFDWGGRRVQQHESDAALPPGAQDQLSVFYQLGYPGYAQRPTEVPIATGRKLVTYHFKVIGEEALTLPFGPTWRTVHVRAEHEETTEIWLALDHFSLPVKIRHIDRKGELYDQIAVDIQVPADATQ